MTPTTTPLSFITTTVIDWVDVFTRSQYKDIVVESLKYCQDNKGLMIYSWVLMSNHLHIVVGIDQQLHNNDYATYSQLLSGVIRDFKKFTSKKLVKAITDNPQESRKEWMLDRFWFRGANDNKIKNYRFWQEGYYNEDIYSMEFLMQKIEYVHMNPMKQGIVVHVEDYLYSSALNYAGMKGLLDIEVVR